MADQNATADVPQRWERPFDFPPGIWKRQLPGKIRAIAMRGDIDGLRDLLSEHPEYLNKHGSHHRTLLWEAVRHGRLAAVRWLVEQGADVDTTACYNGESYVQLTPYCAAVYYRRAEIAEYLQPLAAPADIFRAAFLGDQARVARDLADHPDRLDAEDPRDDLYFVPLLAFPIVGGHAALVEFLLRRGAAVARYSAQLLHLAARDARRDLIDLLVGHGAQIRAVDSGIYVDLDDMQIMEYLLRNGASAVRQGKNGFPPLVYLARGDKGEHPEKLSLLLDYGAEVNAPGPKGRTALHYAAVAGSLRVMALLLDRGAAPNLRDEQGATPLGLARAAGKTEAVALVMQCGANKA